MKISCQSGLFFLLTSVLFFSACDDTKTITVLGENSSNLQAMQALKGQYEKANKIRVEYRPNTFEDAFNKANQDFSNQSGQYDIVLQYNFSLSNFVRNNYVYRSSELSKDIPAGKKTFEADIFPNVWKEVGYYYNDPKDVKSGLSVVSYPFAANTMLLAYNKKFFGDPAYKKAYKDKYHKDLTPPASWEDYKQIAEFFTDKQKGTYGVCMQGASGGWLYYEWCQYLQGFGGKVMDKEWGWMGDENTKVNINSPEALRSTTFMLSLKPFNSGGFINADGNEQIKIMKEGKTAMCLIWSDYVRGLTYNGDEVDVRFGVDPVPGSQSMLAGGSFFISRQSKLPKESFKYVMSVLQKDNQIKLVQKGLCSPLRSAYDAEEVQAIPYVPALKASLTRGVYALEAGPDADMISSTITNYIQQVWTAKKDIPGALQATQTEVITKRKDIFRQLKSK